jgi:hypothetical protein
MRDVQAVKKNEKNTSQNYNFRGIDAVINAVGPALRAHGVQAIPRIADYEYRTIEVGPQKRPMQHVLVTVEYAFFCQSGSAVTATVIAEAMDFGDKAVPKAMSVAYRTALLQTLCLPTDEPDPDLYSYGQPDSEQHAADRAAWETPAPPAKPAMRPRDKDLDRAVRWSQDRKATPEQIKTATGMLRKLDAKTGQSVQQWMEEQGMKLELTSLGLDQASALIQHLIGLREPTAGML